MNHAINTCITGLNNIGQGFWNYAAGIFIQSSVLIVLLLIIDFLLRKRVRAVFRYCLWMLVFIKLVMPASFTLPTGIGYWMGDYFPSEVSMAKWIPRTEEIVPTTLNIHQRSIPLEPVVTNETAVIDIYQDLIPLEPVVTNETAVIDIYQDLIPLEPVVTNERAVTGIELEPICWQGLVFLGWLVGMLALLALLVQRVCFVRGLIAQSRPANGRLLEILDECRCLIGIRQNIELRLTGNRLSPADCGLFKPIILMPATLPEKLSREKLKAVLIHELAHIKRGDVWVNLVQTVLQIIYFYNPFVWLANAMVRRVREQAVDEMVLVTLKPETKSYSNTLIDIAEMAFWRPNFSLRLIGVVESKKALERRIKHMLNRPVPKSSKLGYPGLIAIVLIGAILLPMGSNSIAEAANTQKQSRVHSESNTIVPGVRVGDYTFDMSKDDVLRKLGEPEEIFFAGERYTLDNLPKRYFMSFGDISFGIDNDSVIGITAISPYYKFTNGLGVGDSEQTIKQAFGDDFHFEEGREKDYLTYEDKGLQFEIHNMKRTVVEINVSQTTGDQGDSMKALTPSPLEPFDNVGGKDLHTYDLRIAGAILDTLEFNQETRWPRPDRLPEGFDPKALLQEGMNPGLGVRALHAEGITGAGVHVGLIDQPLLLDHPEYAGKIVSYHDAGCGPSMSSMHGPGMASQLVGSRCGTAPGAKLHVVAVPSWKGDAEYYAKALDRLVTRNREVRKDQKIRVVSVSAQPSGEGSKYINQSLWDRAVQRAQANGILVLDCTWHHGFVSLCWLDPQDRENVEACTPGFRNGIVEVDKGHIHVPSAPRTTAEASAERPYGYAYDGGGRRSSRPMAKNGYSDTIPYTAGILAMGWQIRPNLTPAQMKEMLFSSAYVHESGARIINPRAFIELIRNQSDNQQIRTRPQTYSETQTIVPGLRVGDYTLDMSKDDVLRKLGEPETIQLEEDEIVRRGEEKYSLNNLPREYIMAFGDVSFFIHEDSAQAIFVRSPLYKLSNGLGVGDSEQKIKQAFGEDFHLEEVLGKDFLFYKAKGLAFEFHKKNQTVAEIVVYKPEGDHGDSDAPDQEEHSKHTIVPGVRVGDYTLGISKDEVLKELGEPEAIQLGEDDVDVVHRGEERYSLNNLPSHYILSFGNISFWFNDDTLEVISVHTPLYKLSNGLGVGDSEQKIKQAFGEDFDLEEVLGKDFLCYKSRGLGFEIHKKNQTVAEIIVYQPEGDRGDSDAPDQQDKSKHTIVPGLRVGDYTFDMSKDEVLKRLGEPKSINYEGERYTLNNLPKRYYIHFDDISFYIFDGAIQGMTVHGPLYKFANGLGVGDSEQKMKQAFGNNFHLKEGGKDILTYEDEGLTFEMHKKNRTVMEINVSQITNDHGDSDATSSDKVIMLSEQSPGPITFPKIDRKPKPEEWERGEMKSLPKYDPDSTNPFQMDLRCRDLSNLDLSNSIDDLLYATFDDRTVWPASDKMPHDFDWQKIMELGKNPGLGIRSLHKKGITGRGVSIAILDQPLLVDHQEYAERLRLYEEIHIQSGEGPAMHGAAVASIAVGKTVGVAPEAELYYIAKWNFDWEKEHTPTLRYLAQGIHRILEVNEQLPKDKKIRVISISKGWLPSHDGYDEITAACEEAKAAGIFVVSCSLDRVYGFSFGCLGRHPLASPNLFESYEPGLFWAKGFYDGAQSHSDRLFFPMDSRTTASPCGIDKYVFYRQGGASWSVPYTAGVYALTAQVEPDITPERFWALAMKTGRTIELEHKGEKRSFGPIIDPVALIGTLQKKMRLDRKGRIPF